MNLNDLLQAKGIDPRRVIAFRHRPSEPQLNKVMPWLAGERPTTFNAYQQSQGEKLEKVMASLEGEGHVASFLGLEAGKALFVGLYRIAGSEVISHGAFHEIPQNKELVALGMDTFSAEARPKVRWFTLDSLDTYAHWKGKLVVGWPPPESSW